MTLKAHRFAELYPLMEGDELMALADDIKRNGLIHPIVTFEGRILDGRNRERACFEAGVKPRFVEWTGRGSAVQYVISVNGPRRHLTADQKAAVVLRSLPLLEEEAKQRQLSGLKKGKATAGKSSSASIEANGNAGRSTELAAKAAGISRSSVDRLKRVQDRGAPELIDAVAVGQIKINDAVSVLHLPLQEQVHLVRKLRAEAKKNGTATPPKLRSISKRIQIERVRHEPLPLPSGTFRVILADPPWQYELREGDESHRGRTGYATMNLDAICAMGADVMARAQRDAILLLWTTNAFLADGSASRVVREWGFTGKTILTWAKRTADGRPQIGLGHYLRNSTEHCVIATRGGSPTVDLEAQDTLLLAPRREHSRKPDEFYALVEQVFPGSKLELFAREARPGWVAWGAEADKFTPAQGKIL